MIIEQKRLDHCAFETCDATDDLTPVEVTIELGAVRATRALSLCPLHVRIVRQDVVSMRIGWVDEVQR